MSYSNHLSDLDRVLRNTRDGYLSVSFPSPELIDAIVSNGFIVVVDCTEFTLFKKLDFKPCEVITP